MAEAVHALHETSVHLAPATAEAFGLGRERLFSVLTYCAELTCLKDGATCPGCRRRTERQGFANLDAYAARWGEIVTASGLSVRGQGTERLAVQSLEALAKSWAGEEYWFWARRVLRKLRHGLRRADAGHERISLEAATPAIILVEPQLADNIGMVARAMANFALEDLRLVAPRDGWPNEKARIAASGANYILDGAGAFPTLDAAVADLNWVGATTARQRPLRKPVLTPEQAVGLMRSRLALGERCGILFGRERSGLETDEVAGTDALIMIPVNSRFASLNLAQAVLILGYEWLKTGGGGTLGRVTTYEKPVSSGLNLGGDRPATKEELLGLFEHLEQALDEAEFFRPPDRRPAVVRNLRSMLARLEPTAQEVRTLRGVITTLVGSRTRKPAS